MGLGEGLRCGVAVPRLNSLDCSRGLRRVHQNAVGSSLSRILHTHMSKYFSHASLYGDNNYVSVSSERFAIRYY